MIITDQELEKFRNAFQGNEEAMDTLKIVKDCDGNLEEAMGIVADIAADRFYLGDQDWIDFENLGKELRNLICSPAFESAFVQGSFGVGLAYLTTQSNYSMTVLLMVMLFVFKMGLDHFCQSQKTS